MDDPASLTAGGMDEDAAGGVMPPAVRPSRPDVPMEMRRFTAGLLAELGDTPAYMDAVKSREADLGYLKPDASGADGRRESKSVTRGTSLETDVDAVETRQVRVPWVLRQAEQTTASTVSPNLSFSAKARKKLTKQNRAPAADDLGAQALARFGETAAFYLDDVAAKGIGAKVVRWNREATWHRHAVLRLTYAPEVGPIPSLPDQDLRDNIARIQQIRLGLALGDIRDDDEEVVELNRLTAVVGARRELVLDHRWRAEVYSLDRWKCDPRVRSGEDVVKARWQEYLHLLTREEVERKFPFVQNADGTWMGVHADDLTAATVCDGNGRKLALDEVARLRTERQAKLNTEDLEVITGQEIILVHEMEHRELGEVFFLIDGVDYPVGSYVPARPPRQWFSGHFLAFNDGPEAISGMSDTEQQGPIQDRMNRKDTDFEWSRFLGMIRGYYLADEVDPRQQHMLEMPPPGKIKGISTPGGVKSIDDLVQWKSLPVNPALFDKADDWQAFRYMARQSEQSMGMTGGSTTATAIMAAQRGSEQAFNARQNRMRMALIEVGKHILEVAIQAIPPSDMLRLTGAEGFWPRFMDEAEAQRAKQQIDQKVQQAIAAELEQERQAAQEQGALWQPDTAAIDTLIAQRTEQAWVQMVGTTEPMTRQELYEELDITVDVGVDGGSADAAKVQAATQLATTLVNVNGGPIPGMVEPLARRIGRLIGEDVDQWFTMDARAAVAALQNADPSSLQPEELMALAQFGQVAMQRLQDMQAQQKPGKDGAAAAAPAPASGVPQAPQVPTTAPVA